MEAESVLAPESAREDLGVVILGEGFGERVHRPGFERLRGEGVRVVAVAGRGDDWRKLALREDVRIVSIATPPFVHREQALAAFAAGKAVLCEKPLGLDGTEANEMVSAADRTGVPALIDFEFRAHRAFARAQELLLASAVGDIERVNVEWRLPPRDTLNPSWKDSAELGGGTLLSLGVHVFDYIEWLVAPIVAVRGTLLASTEKDRSADHGCRATLTLEGDIEAALDISTVAGDRIGHRLAVTGSGGVLVLHNREPFGHLGAFELGIGRRPIHVEPPRRGEDARIGPFTELARRLVLALREGSPAEPGLTAGLRAQLVADALRRSDRLGTWTPVVV